ncbi:MAG: hypothetical protein CMF96_00540 [Candidatus Marinimicrobia bacterium]|nr:hypothetical protein [Candidatus Neomarinimicrobiota bacterium]|tara:strand:+ start:1859 stop:2410 length:552 start_codon:yes stop_codon:yes gene_type:complete
MKKILTLFTISILFPISNSDLWQTMEKKFEVELAQYYINYDFQAFYDYFAPNHKINVYQYGLDKTGKGGDGKHLKIYTGNFFSSLIRGRIPGKIFVKTFFNRLRKQDYKQSNIELRGILKDNDKILVYIRFDRVNNSNEKYLSARAVYTLNYINQKWLTTEMSTYDDVEETDLKVGYNKMWKP